ncbi:hypothetical protein PARPLA_02427 [Rhodobacteraceae bacterium THAF1]|nr:hypothetical protein FIU81_11185 [Palleronia sp. THAF1]VDC27363.1 hypothetical protein PARPLA_02427 [Rhodobacteraceae bacterium THAF1]
MTLAALGSARLWHVAVPGWTMLGLALIAAALGLMLWATLTMLAARTNPLPHTQPSALVTTGPFRFSRNPIYLGDVLIVCGASLWAGAPLGLLCAAVLVVILRARFILPEEGRLRAAFGAAVDPWMQAVPRWV